MLKSDLIFKAVAHPARRQIIELLSGGDRSVKDLTRAFEISQPAVSQHLRELRAASLVRSKRVGLENRYTLTGKPIRAVYEWSRRYRRFFDPSGHIWLLSEEPRGKGAPHGR